MVFPGGGYRGLAMVPSGIEVCDWLTTRGITCVLLKYRVPGSGPYSNVECQCRRTPTVPMASQDAACDRPIAPTCGELGRSARNRRGWLRRVGNGGGDKQWGGARLRARRHGG